MEGGNPLGCRLFFLREILFVRLENNLAGDTSWDIYEERFFPDQFVTTGSNYMVGNGYLGYRGTFSHDRADRYPACVLSDTYDNADGRWKELVTVPNGLYTRIEADGVVLAPEEAPTDYRRELEFRYATWRVAGRWPDLGVELHEERVAGLHDVHLLFSRTTIRAVRRVDLRIVTGIDSVVWSLHGDHFARQESAVDGEQIETVGRTAEHGYTVNVRESAILSVGKDDASRPTWRIETTVEGVYRTVQVSLDAGVDLVLEKRVVCYGSNDLRSGGVTGGFPLPSQAEVRGAGRSALERATTTAWDDLIAAHRAAWDRRWKNADITIDGDEAAQTVLRYNLYHNIIATPAHTDHLPIGARGLSCQAYQGAAFWDQEIFNLPQFLFTEPEIARNILVYRYRTLDGARKKARDLGYRGAFYAWISGDSGEEICPSYFFVDVISGRPIRNHFNDWQIHVSPDIAYTVRRYVETTGDKGFLIEYGAEIVFEVARFLFSRAHYSTDRERYEIIRVLGPDEYHENVDNNAFTNVQTQYALQYAVDVYRWMGEHAKEALVVLAERIGLAEREVERWADLATKIYIPQPDPKTRVIEQFDGFFDLEDTTPEEIKKRLLDPGEYWGWPNGIAVATQVSKQADVTQLFVAHPTMYDRSTMKANWDYYEPRTQHGSSLSPAVYAIVAARIGHMEEALRYFFRSSTVDLYNTAKAISGGTFIGGIHTAACGVAWQIVVQGFAGMYLTADGFGFRPHLPWERICLTLSRWGRTIGVEVRRGDRKTVLTVSGAEANDGAVGVELGKEHAQVAPGARVELSVPVGGLR